jgi:adenylosuccinate lyase
MITAISPIDGRYASKTASLTDYFSELALIKYRIRIEVLYFKALVDIGLPQLAAFPRPVYDQLDKIWQDFTESDGAEVKAIEKTTNHDVKAVEYFIKAKFDELGVSQYKEFIHFGLTSQDINNTATPLLIKEALEEVLLPSFEPDVNRIKQLSQEYAGIPMLAKTHGQPASPTTMGKEWMVYIERIEDELALLDQLQLKAKFGGATGNYNAHKVTYPDIDWRGFGDHFVNDTLGLKRSFYTTQIAHYDDIGALCHGCSRINTILIDFCRDVWTYISMDYFKQKTIAGEVGSSAMPHKVNPIDFENAEGNLGIANALFGHFAAKLPISRLQRDLTDSTVLRNVGVPFGHCLIADASIRKGLGKLLINTAKLQSDLDDNWAVVAEAIQNILRREGYDKPYEALKDLTRGKASIGENDISTFIDGLAVSADIKAEMHAITPSTYVGYW